MSTGFHILRAILYEMTISQVKPEDYYNMIDDKKYLNTQPRASTEIFFAPSI